MAITVTVIIVDRSPNLVLHEGSEQPAAHRADGEHEEHDDGHSHAAEAVGKDRLDRGPDHRERSPQEGPVHHPPRHEQVHVGHEVLNRHGRGQREQQCAENAKGSVGIPLERLVESFADDRKEEQQAKGGGRDGQSPLPCVEAELLFEEEALNRAGREQGKAQGDQSDGHVPDGVNAPETGKGGFGGDVHSLLGFQRSTENLAFFPLAALGLGDAQGKEPHHRNGDAEYQVGPSPALITPGDGGHCTDENRADRSRHL